MFDRLFEHPFVLARQRNGPLAEERRRYLAHCAKLSRETTRIYAKVDLAALRAVGDFNLEGLL